MASITTVASLIADIKVKTQMQAASTAISDSNIVDMANNELQTVIVPWVMGYRERFFSAFKDYTISSRTRYRLPPRIVGGRIFDVQINDGTRIYSLNYKSPGEISARAGFTIDGNDLVIWMPNSNTQLTGIMRVSYPCRPPDMGTTLNTTSPVTSVAATSVTAAAAGSGSFEVINGDTFLTVSPTVTFAAGVGTNPDILQGDDYTGIYAVNDLVLTGSFTPNVPLTRELRDLLSYRVCQRIRSAWGHKDEVDLAQIEINKIEKHVSNMLSPRVENEEKVCVDKETLGWRTW